MSDFIYPVIPSVTKVPDSFNSEYSGKTNQFNDSPPPYQNTRSFSSVPSFPVYMPGTDSSSQQGTKNVFNDLNYSFNQRNVSHSNFTAAQSVFSTSVNFKISINQNQTVQAKSEIQKLARSNALEPKPIVKSIPYPQPSIFVQK